MWRAALAALALTTVACGASIFPDSQWTIDASIYGTYDHFGNPPNGPGTFICGIAYDLHFRGQTPLDSIDVAVMYPTPFLAIEGTGVTRDAARVSVITIDGHDVRAAAARSGHSAGAVGGICPHGASDLPALKGTVVHVVWRDRSGDHVQEIAVDRIRDIARQWGGDASTDWQPRFEWR